MKLFFSLILFLVGTSAELLSFQRLIELNDDIKLSEVPILVSPTEKLRKDAISLRMPVVFSMHSWKEWPAMNWDLWRLSASWPVLEDALSVSSRPKEIDSVGEIPVDSMTPIFVTHSEDFNGGQLSFDSMDSGERTEEGTMYKPRIHDELMFPDLLTEHHSRRYFYHTNYRIMESILMVNLIILLVFF
jgi:hypothetical protein